MKKFLSRVLPLILILVGIVAAVFLLRAVDESNKPVPQPTRIPLAGPATVIFEQVNEERANQGLATFEPGLNSTQIIETAVQATLVTVTPLPTLEPTQTNTPQPTHTLIPSGTPRPTVAGVATQIFERVQQIQAANGVATLPPGTPIEEFIELAAQGTATALAQP